MPPITREGFIASLKQEISSQLMRFRADASRPDVVEAAMSVEHHRSDIELMADSGTGRTLSPDLAFGPAGARFPPVVIEVAFPRDGKDLSELSSAYIAGSSGSVRLVVGIDIQCLLRKMGTLSVWWPVERLGKDGSRQVHAMRAINDDLFRYDGFPFKGGDFSLVIPLAVFRLPGATTPLPFEAISIPHQTLCSFLVSAEDNCLLGLVEDAPTGAGSLESEAKRKLR